MRESYRIQNSDLSNPIMKDLLLTYERLLVQHNASKPLTRYAALTTSSHS